MKKHLILKNVASIALATCLGMNIQAQTTFPAFEEITPSGTPMIFRGTAMWGDYDNDGKLEVLAFGREPETWAVRSFMLKPNDNNGLDLMASDLSMLGFPVVDGLKANDLYNVIMQWIDYNNDGLMDILFMGNLYDENRPDPDENNPDKTDNDYALFFDLYENTGSGSFERVSDTGLEGLYVEEESNYASVISVGDYDNDGYMDLIATGRRNGERRVDLYKNDRGSGRFIRQLSPLKSSIGEMQAFTPQNAGSVTFADFNNDGWLDIIVNGWNSDVNNALVMMYLNNRDGSFMDNMINYDIADAGSKSQIGVADINSDGHLDFLLSGEYLAGKDEWRKSSSIYYYDKEDYGYAVFRYAAGSEIGLGSFQKAGIDFADFNSDGLLDFVMGGEVGNGIPRTTIYMQEEGDMFNSLDGDDLVGSVRSGAIMTLGDYNNDGYLDAMSMGYNNLTTGDREGLHFGVFRNEGNLPKNEAPTAPSNLAASESDGMVHFSWDAGSDKETATEALRYNFFLKKSNGELYMLIPADTTNGFLRTTNHVTALGTTSYSMSLPAGEYEWGVQTIDQSKAGSAFVRSTALSTASKADVAIAVNANAFVKDGRIFVSTDKPASVTIFDVNGSLLHTESLSGSSYLNATLLPGTYLVKTQVGDGVKNIKVIL